METRTLTVDVIVPTYKPGKKFRHLLSMLAVQTYPVNRVVVVNTEKQYWKPEFEGIVELDLTHIRKSQFDHGATRHQAMERSTADVAVCMTDDAVPADKYLIERLVKALEQTGPKGEPVIQAYARQLPNKDCGVIERYTRSFNYPEESRIKTKKDLEELGIKTFFASNVCCAYRRELYLKQGGFIRRTIFNEDMIFAGKAIQEGFAVAYAADARVVHSHNYSCMEQLRRNFDLAVSQADHPEVFAAVRSESEGVRLVKQTATYLVKTGRAYLLPELVVKSGFKYLGYKLGKGYQRLPGGLAERCSMNRGYWKKEDCV